MLALSRKVDERVIITIPRELLSDKTSDLILTLSVAEIDSAKVRLAFDAPRAVAIDREEISERKARVRAFGRYARGDGQTSEARLRG